MHTFLIVLFFVLCLQPLYAHAASYPRAAVYGTDALGRVLPEATETDEFRRDRFVGIFYFLRLDLSYVTGDAAPIGRFRYRYEAKH